MTTLLQQAFDAASKLPAAEQDLLAARILAELVVEDDFDQAIAASSTKLTALAAAALAEHRAGRTQPLDPERLGTRTRPASSGNCWPHSQPRSNS